MHDENDIHKKLQIITQRVYRQKNINNSIHTSLELIDEKLKNNIIKYTDEEKINIINDRYNNEYYIDANYTGEIKDGSRLHPFNELNSYQTIISSQTSGSYTFYLTGTFNSNFSVGFLLIDEIKFIGYNQCTINGYVNCINLRKTVIENINFTHNETAIDLLNGVNITLKNCKIISEKIGIDAGINVNLELIGCNIIAKNIGIKIFNPISIIIKNCLFQVHPSSNASNDKQSIKIISLNNSEDVQLINNDIYGEVELMSATEVYHNIFPKDQGMTTNGNIQRVS